MIHARAMIGSRRRHGLIASGFALLCCPLSMHGAAAASKSFVVGYFYPATYYGDDTCPRGLNPLPDVFFKRDLKILGLPQADIDAMFDKDYNNQNGKPTTNWVSVAATRGNGRDNVYVHPTTVPDAHLTPAVGRFGYGFNLDGKGAASPYSYEDPETHEKGVNNQLFRAIGCIPAYKGSPPPQPPLEAEYRWDSTRMAMGAWVITISGDDLGRDGDVTVTLESSIDPATTQDANAHIQSDMTYRVLARSASRNVLRGVLKNGVILTEPATIVMKCDPYIQPTFEFREARLRLQAHARRQAGRGPRRLSALVSALLEPRQSRIHRRARLWRRHARPLLCASQRRRRVSRRQHRREYGHIRRIYDRGSSGLRRARGGRRRYRSLGESGGRRRFDCGYRAPVCHAHPVRSGRRIRADPGVFARGAPLAGRAAHCTPLAARPIPAPHRRRIRSHRQDRRAGSNPTFARTACSPWASAVSASPPPVWNNMTRWRGVSPPRWSTQHIAAR